MLVQISDGKNAVSSQIADQVCHRLRLNRRTHGLHTVLNLGLGPEGFRPFS